MSKRIAFRSVANPNLAYTWHTTSLDWALTRNGRPISDHAGQFVVYNSDRPVQHSHESAVQADAWVDWSESLASHLLENPADAAIVAEGWPHECHAFARTEPYHVVNLLVSAVRLQDTARRSWERHLANKQRAVEADAMP